MLLILLTTRSKIIQKQVSLPPQNLRLLLLPQFHSINNAAAHKYFNLSHADGHPTQVLIIIPCLSSIYLYIVYMLATPFNSSQLSIKITLVVDIDDN